MQPAMQEKADAGNEEKMTDKDEFKEVKDTESAEDTKGGNAVNSSLKSEDANEADGAKKAGDTQEVRGTGEKNAFDTKDGEYEEVCFVCRRPES